MGHLEVTQEFVEWVCKNTGIDTNKVMIMAIDTHEEETNLTEVTVKMVLKGGVEK